MIFVTNYFDRFYPIKFIYTINKAGYTISGFIKKLNTIKNMDYKEAVTYNLKGYYKIVDVIDSCETIEHMQCCSNLANAYANKMDYNIKQLWKEFFKFPTYKKIKNIFKYRNHCNLVINNLITLVNEKIQLFQNSEDDQTFPKIKGFAGDE